MWSPMTLSHLTLSCQIQGHSDSEALYQCISCKGAELGHTGKLLLNINKKAYMGSPMTLSHMTLSDLER